MTTTMQVDGSVFVNWTALMPAGEGWGVWHEIVFEAFNRRCLKDKNLSVASFFISNRLKRYLRISFIEQ
jgi:hypothetical protein